MTVSSCCRTGPFVSCEAQRVGAYTLTTLTGPSEVLSRRMEILFVLFTPGSDIFSEEFLTVRPTPCSLVSSAAFPLFCIGVETRFVDFEKKNRFYDFCAE